MKQRVLALAIKRIVWAELALTAVLAPPAFAQSQPAPGAVAIADAVASGAPVTVTGRAAQRAAPLHRTLRRPMQHPVQQPTRRLPHPPRTGRARSRRSSGSK